MQSTQYRQDLHIPKPIIFVGKFLQFFSLKWAMRYAVKVFGKPIKYPTPKRELGMDANSTQKPLYIKSLNKEIVVYEYGKSDKKILLAHGWNGRGTQLVKIADTLLALGYQTISFDAPGHGKAKGNFSHMAEFIDCIMQLEKEYGPFHAAVGHSLGAMALLNSVKKGLKLNSIVIIGSGDIVSDIVDNFIYNMQLKPKVSELLQLYFEDKVGAAMNSYSASVAAKEVNIPVMVIHDEDDKDVPVSAAINIDKHLPNSTLYITKKLGHQKILGNGTVIDNLCKHIETSKN